MSIFSNRMSDKICKSCTAVIEKIQEVEEKTEVFVINQTKIFKTMIPPLAQPIFIIEVVMIVIKNGCAPLKSDEVRKSLRFLAPSPGKMTPTPNSQKNAMLNLHDFFKFLFYMGLLDCRGLMTISVIRMCNSV